MKFCIFGLSITSSWGNGHATTYRGIVRELAERGHEILFLERDLPWYAANRDLASPDYCRTILYSSLDKLLAEHGRAIREADCVMVGSYVPEGIAVGHWVTGHSKGCTAFYDIDTPVTLAMLERGDCQYLDQELVPRYRLYLSFTGGPILDLIESRYGSPAARPLYCSVDPRVHSPSEQPTVWDLGYLGTYSKDRQSPLERLLCLPAISWGDGKFVVAGPQYPQSIKWPANVQRIEHLPPEVHSDFYNGQRFTLNITRKDMIKAGYSPSVRLFEAAACAVPVISDQWEGIEEFFIPGEEILLASSAEEVLSYLREFPESERREIGLRAREKALRRHSSAARAEELEAYVKEALQAE